MNLFKPEQQVEIDLAGTDGNIFAVIGAWRKAARRQGWSKEDIQKVTDEATKQKSYDGALCVIISHTK